MEKVECHTADVGINSHGVLVKDLRFGFADDVDLLAEDEAGLQSIVNILQRDSGAYGLKMNINKTKVMAFEKHSTSSPSIKAGTEELQCVSEFVYLGSLFVKNNDCTPKIKCRINLASQRLGMMKNP